VATDPKLLNIIEQMQNMPAMLEYLKEIANTVNELKTAQVLNTEHEKQQTKDIHDLKISLQEFKKTVDLRIEELENKVYDPKEGLIAKTVVYDTFIKKVEDEKLFVKLDDHEKSMKFTRRLFWALLLPVLGIIINLLFPGIFP